MCFIKRKPKPIIMIKYRLKGTEHWIEDSCCFTSLEHANYWIENAGRKVWPEFDWEAFEVENYVE